jgi:hypothetical protein
MTTDLTTSTTDAAIKLFEATRDASLTLWGETLSVQARSLKQAQAWLDEARAAGDEHVRALETLREQVRRGQEAGQELASALYGAGLAGLRAPAAIAEQNLRKAAGGRGEAPKVVTAK